MRQGRALLALILLFGALAASRAAVAQSAGSELAEALAADVVGEEAYAGLTSVEGFPPDGGEAVLEPGTDYEEAFSYTSVDTDTNRLIGLTRPAPLAHAAGVFVQAPQPEAASPAPEPTASTSSPPADPPSSGDESSPGSASTDAGEADAEDDASDSSAPPEPCEPVLDATCADILGQLIEPCAELSAVACEIVDDLEPEDLCDPDNTGQTCLQYIGDILGPFIDDDLCDPDNTGQTCLQYIGDILGPFIDDDLCDPDNTGETCAEYLNNRFLTQCEQLTDCEGTLADCGLSQPFYRVPSEDLDALTCLGETVPTTGLWVDPPIIIPVVGIDGSLHPCSVSPVIDDVSYNHGFLATNVDVHGDSHIESDCRTLVEDLHAEVHITTTSRTQFLSPLGSSSSNGSCDSDTPGTCNVDLLHQYPAADALPSTISWRFYFSWEVPAHDNFIFEIERCFRAVYWGPIHSIPCQPGTPIE